MFEVTFDFSPGLRPLLYRPHRSLPLVIRRLGERTSVKDAIESCGVPHPEVDLLRVEGVARDLNFVLGRPADVEVFGVGEKPDRGEQPSLQPPTADRFVADGHLGTLARRLRLLGIDVWYSPQSKDTDLLDIMRGDDRALLTRDRRLLMHRIVEAGYCPRSDDPDTQTAEVVRRFQLLPRLLRPFTRCLRCNGVLQPVPKHEVEAELPPLTRRYYEDFHRCASCGKIYWNGAHAEKLHALVSRVRSTS